MKSSPDIRKLYTQDDSETFAGLLELSEDRFHRLTALLAALLKYGTRGIRNLVVLELVKIPTPEAIDLLTKFFVRQADYLHEEYEPYTFQVALNHIYGLLKTDEYFDLLLSKLLYSDSTDEILFLIDILGDLRDIRAKEVLEQIAEKKSFDKIIRAKVQWAISQVDQESIKSVRQQDKTDPSARILIAEDERDIRDLTAFTLRFAGYEVIVAGNGEEALELITQYKPDLVILDERMPRMTGCETCRIIKTTPSIRRTPVIFLSAKGQESEIARGMAQGAEEYYLKPFAPDQLTNAVQKIFQKIRLGIYDE